MALSRQLLLLISVLFLMIFSVNFILSVSNIREYLEGEAEVHAQDTATSLGLSLSPHMAEETDPIIETMMNAIFDMGYYQEIKLVNVENQPLVTLTNKTMAEGVPGWFIEALPMKIASAESEISSGWNIKGVVHVTLNPGYAYRKLYEQAKSSLYYSLATFALSIILLHILLRVTLAPLKKIDQMALKIAAGKFETIDQLPWTTEVKNVTTSMNMMSAKVEAAIKSLNAKLESIGKKLLQDDLTGLPKKSSFETEMEHLFSAESDIEAYIFVIKIDGLNALVKELGTDAIDAFIKDFSEALTGVAENSGRGDIFVYRFIGSEFVLLVKQINHQQVEWLAKRLKHSFAEVGAKYKKPDIAHIGIVPFNPTGTIDSILLAGNEAYEQAQLIGANSFYIRTGDDPAKDIAEWKSLVFSIIDMKKYSVSFVGSIKSFETEQILMVDAFTRVLDKKGKQLSIATFVSIAEKFAKIIELDKGVILKVIEQIERKSIDYAVAINLSTRTIKSSDFRSWLAELVQQNQVISRQLVFSLSAYAVAKDFSAYKEFIEFVHQLNARVMIKRFETQSLSPELAKELNPDFIRLARDLAQGVATDKGKAEFAETMKDIGDLLDISILAENVNSDDDYIRIKTIGIAGASR